MICGKLYFVRNCDESQAAIVEIHAIPLTQKIYTTEHSVHITTAVVLFKAMFICMVVLILGFCHDNTKTRRSPKYSAYFITSFDVIFTKSSKCADH